MSHKFKYIIFGVLILFVVWFLKFSTTVLAVTESDCLNKDVSQLTPGEMDECINTVLPRIASAYAPAQQKNKEDLTALNKQLTDLNSRIVSLGKQLVSLEKQISGREEDLAFTKEIFDEKAKEHYTFLRLYDPITPFLFSDTASQAFQEITLRQRAADQDRKTMEQYATDLSTLNTDRESLTKNKASLSSLQSQVAEKQKFLASEVAKVDSYLSVLSAKQNELAAAKAGGFSTSVGDVPLSAEPCSGKPGSSNFCDPGFKPAFAVFSYGAPHRNGLSQYGAYGRSKSGQNAETILKAYYGSGIEIRHDYPTSTSICVGSSKSSCTNVDLETYAKRIYEVPSSWGDSGGMEALKAQAVAARSYALADMQRRGYICATESCQVYKPSNKGGNWESAVNATSGWVLISNGKPLWAKYAASAGGYVNSYTDTAVTGYTTPDLWDTPSGQGGWPNSAYEIAGGSPWFYKGWYKDRSGASCGRNNPWLNSTEMADILNAWRVLYDGAGGDVSRIVPVACWGGNPYSISDLAGIGGFTNVTSVNTAVYGSSGSTINITFQTNNGPKTIPGDQLKKAFNLRAPGYIGVKSSLFNIEKL